MRILVYGAGVIGCELAHELHRAGNDVTLLARGAWRKNIDEKGLLIHHAGKLGMTKDKIHTIEELEREDIYDLIFVVMQYSQLSQILERLAENKSQYIVLIGNNMKPAQCQQAICQSTSVNKEVAFGFQGNGGTREADKVVSMHFNKIEMNIGGLKGRLDRAFETMIQDAFEHTIYQLIWEQRMEDWLYAHAAHILPNTFVCYALHCKMHKISWKQVGQMVDAMNEAYTMLESLGYDIGAEGKAYCAEPKKKRRMLYLLMKSPAGKYMVANHCSHAKVEMTQLAEAFEVIREKSGRKMPVWEQLRQEAL